MDEEKKGNSFLKKSGDLLKKGTKKLAKQGMKKILKKVITAIAPYLLKIIAIPLIVAIIITAIENIIEEIFGKTTEEANAFAVHYQQGSSVASREGSSPNRIVVDVNNATTDGEYELTYEFEDEEGNLYEEEDAMENIKADLLAENPNLDISKFSDSELKIIGALMYNGLQVEKCDEEELKALVIFVKAGIASQSFDLRSAEEIGQAVNIDEIAENDEVYGTLQVHKTKVKEGSNGEIQYTEEVLEYISYEEFSNMVEGKNLDVIDKFSIDEEGNLVIAKWSTRTVTHTYQDEEGREINKENIPDENVEENINETFITVTPINYTQYISEYTASFGFLSNLLVVTDNVDFCLDLAQLVLNSKIIINIKEELTTTNSTTTSNYTESTLIYDYVQYEVFGEQKETEPYEEVAYEYEELPKETNQNASGDLITSYGKHITEIYEDYTIDEDYTDSEMFKYTIVTETETKSNKYSLEISEVDCWYAKYKKEYNSPQKNINQYNNEQPVEIRGQYPQEATEIIGVNISDDEHVKTFINNRKMQYKRDYPNAENIRCTVTNLVVKEKSKTDCSENTTTTITTYEFGEEVADTTKVQMKNVEYINGRAVFNDEEPGFLQIYHNYRSNEIDLFLEDDAEKLLFELLEGNEETAPTVKIIKYLLYVYDGVDRGVTNLKLSIIDLSGMNTVKGSSTENYIKAWENNSLWLYETGQTTIFPSEYLTEDEAHYIVYEDGSNGHNNIAYGIVSYNWAEYFLEVGIVVDDLYEGAIVDKQSTDEVFQNEILPYFENKVEDYLQTNLPEYEFSQAQKDALISICYQYGNINGFADAYINSLHEDGTIDAERIKNNFVVEGTLVFSYSGTTNDRKYANWLLFTQEKYIDRAGNEIALGGGIVSMAKTIHDYMAENLYYYCTLGNEQSKNEHISAGISNCGLANSFGASQVPGNYGYRLTCCATYVSWVLEELGYIEKHFNGCYALKDELEIQGWILIQNYDDLEAGDIVFMDTDGINDGQLAHVQLYVGDGCWYNAGGNWSIHQLEPYADNVRSEFIYAYRKP